MVGAVLVRDGRIVGEGWHRRFGDLHAEIEAIQAAGEQTRGATLYVTLEPCCHHGKRPPCADAVIAAGITRVAAAVQDPFPQVAGGGFDRLRQAGLQVDVGLLETEAREIVAPFAKLVTTGRPWVIAKWAMTLDGKLATRTGDSQWISSEASRAIVHRLRGRVDAILVGSRTAAIDDPLLTARLPENIAPQRVATRIVLDSRAKLSLTSKLVQTIGQAPVLVAVGPEADERSAKALASAGCEVLQLAATEPGPRVCELLDALGRRRMTNLLVEGGAAVLGTFFDRQLVDEVHAFIAPLIAGGEQAPSPVRGVGIARMSEAWRLPASACELIGGDAYFHGRTVRSSLA